MRPFLSFFRQFLNPFATSNTRIFASIAWKMNCDILKSKLILCEWNAFYFIEIAFIGFTLQEIKQCIVFCGTPGIYNYYFVTLSKNLHVYKTTNVLTDVLVHQISRYNKLLFEFRLFPAAMLVQTN